ncbi:MAG: TraR/DksA C4-type zinc finger protein [Bacteroidota bacterium]
MAIRKTTPAKTGNAVSADTSTKKTSTKTAKDVVEKAADKAVPGNETTIKKPAAKEVAKPVSSASKNAGGSKTAQANDLEKAGKIIQKPSETVKEKTTAAAGATKEEAPAKKKAGAKAEEAAPKKSEAKVKIPKTSATGKVPYEPDFTHSVLDSPREEEQQTSSVPSMRYSDSELHEFRTLIQRKLESAKKELAYLQGLITRKDEMGGDNDDGRYMTMEDGSLSMEREQLSQMASRQITFIDHLEKALMRIENKTYGVCRVTGKLIEKARLRAVPHATLSMEAKSSKTRVL